MAHRLGIQSELEAVPSIALGTGEVTLLELTGAFTAFANGGEVAVPFVIKRVLSADGRVMFERQGSRGGQELGARETADMNMMLTSVMNAGTGTRARLAVHPAAGKTGTTQDYRDAWFIGYTGHYTAGVWVGNDDNSEMKRVTGGSIPASIWKEVMNKAHEGLDVISLEPSADLPPPPVDPYYNRQPSIGSFLSSLFGGRPSQPQPTYGYPDRYRDSYGRPLGPRYPGIAQGRQPAMPYQRLAPPRADQRSARPSSFGSFLGNVFGRRELKDDPRDY
jgi:penicillin-binding protein 1A